MTNPDLPQVALCLACSLDGKINDGAHPYPNFTSRYDRSKLFRLRALHDVLLVGANTVRQEELPPLIRQPELLALREGKPPHPAVCIVSASQNLPWTRPYFTKRRQELFILTGKANASTSAESNALGFHILETGEPVCLRSGLHQLKARGFETVLAEGGGKLTYALLNEGLVDALYLTIAPTMIAGHDTPNLCNGPTFRTPTGFDLVRTEQHESELHLEYRIRKNPR